MSYIYIISYITNTTPDVCIYICIYTLCVYCIYKVYEHLGSLTSTASRVKARNKRSDSPVAVHCTHSSTGTVRVRESCS